jgi:hypothetical protein
MRPVSVGLPSVTGSATGPERYSAQAGSVITRAACQLYFKSESQRCRGPSRARSYGVLTVGPQRHWPKGHGPYHLPSPDHCEFITVTAWTVLRVRLDSDTGLKLSGQPGLAP